MSPLATLNRGYSILRKQNGAVILDINQIDIGEKVTTRLANGEITSTIDSLRK